MLRITLACTESPAAPCFHIRHEPGVCLLATRVVLRGLLRRHLHLALIPRGLDRLHLRLAPFLLLRPVRAQQAMLLSISTFAPIE